MFNREIWMALIGRLLGMNALVRRSVKVGLGATSSKGRSCFALFFGLIPSLADVTFDGFTVVKFILGHVYAMHLPLNDSRLKETNCTVKIEGPMNTSTDEENVCSC